MWLCQRAQRDFRTRGREGLGFFLPGLFPLLEGPELVFVNRRGEDGQDLATVRKELTDWLRKAIQARVSEPLLGFPRLQLENLLDPLPRSRPRARLLARQPRLLYRAGLARGAARIRGFPENLWDRIGQVATEDVERVLRERFTPEKALFVALVPPEPKK